MYTSRSMIVCAVLWSGTCTLPVEAAPDQPLRNASVTLQRSSCFGNCPAYSVTVTSDGQVSFEGHVHVQTGSARGHATPTQFANILAVVEQVGFRSMRDSYVSSDDGCVVLMSDQAGVKITVVDTTGSKTVNFYNGCTGATADAARTGIQRLARSIDQQLATARWIGKPAAPGDAGKTDR
ncbi:DUF6438 domain-containing protein [Rhodanobacter sp. C03]|uniref:DUF6438 domain-containing protein n=1 Tax=Rhodanobacter sp. C03 TaxID=1945858 RepID=UPI000985E48E|nr:DUF6438 domain-containing protein [Rhodanobacter sp. C03]OOG59880.1 hypothetical protein B0E48_03590 [Rhodanobacter sp. C03]